MGNDASREAVEQVERLLVLAQDASGAPLPRIAASLAAGVYLEALTRQLVDEAREQGHSWEELAEVFATSAANVRHRFGSYRNYDDD